MTFTVKKISVFYDLSEGSRLALRWGLSLHRETQAPLTIVHVVESSRHDMTANEHHLSVLEEFIRDEITKDLEKVAQEPDEKTSVSVTIVKGPVVEALLEVIQADAPDLVVMGHKGVSQNRPMGSVAEKMARFSPVPVLIVKKETPWPPKRMLLPVEVREPTDELMEAASFFNRLHPIIFHLLHVIPQSDYLRNLPEKLSQLFSSDPDTPYRYAEFIFKQMTTAHPDLSLVPHQVLGPVVKEIASMTHEEDIPLILMATHARKGMGRFFLGSIAEQVLREANANILLFCPQHEKHHREKMAGPFDV